MSRVKFSQRKVSFFDYQFLESVVLGPPAQAFVKPVAFFILSKESNELEQIEQELGEAAVAIKKFNQEC